MAAKVLNIIAFGLLSFVVAVSATKLRDRNTKPYRIVCYFDSRAGNRHSDGLMTPEDIDPQACTHLIYTYATLTENKINVRDEFLDLDLNWRKAFYKKFNALRKRNSELTTLVAIGEWQDGLKKENHKFSELARDPAKRKTFVNSVIEFLKEHDFDGLDFVWEYLRADDKNNFVLLLKDLKTAFEPHGFLLSIGVSASRDIVEASYDIKQVANYADIINVMSYDFHGSWESRTGHNSPLYSRPDEIGDDEYQNIDFAIRLWINNGADKKKLTLGMPLYGRCYRLDDKTRNGYGALAPNAGTPGPYTQKPGIIGYNELCVNQKTEPWTTVWNDYHHAPYTYRGDQWCSYDDVKSLTLKVQYLKALNLGGAMVWTLDTDDFRGLCSNTKSPLLFAIRDALNNKNSDIPTTPSGSGTSPVTPTKIPSTTKSDIVNVLCKKEGLLKVPNECTKYIQCIQLADGFQAIERACPAGTAFNEKNDRCDFPQNVNGCH